MPAGEVDGLAAVYNRAAGPSPMPGRSSMLGGCDRGGRPHLPQGCGLVPAATTTPTWRVSIYVTSGIGPCITCRDRPSPVQALSRLVAGRRVVAGGHVVDGSWTVRTLASTGWTGVAHILRSMRSLPATSAGRWSVGFLAVAVLGGLGLFAATAAGQRGGTSFADSWWLSAPALLVAGAAVAALVTSVVSLVRGERSVTVVVVGAAGLLVTVFVVGELVAPH